MRSHINILLLTFFFGMALITAARETASGKIAQAQTADGVITGQLLHPSSDAILEGIEVQLDTFDNTSRRTVGKMDTDEKGRFSFDHVPTDAGSSYVLRGIFQGVGYQSEKKAFPEGKEELELNLQVYDSTPGPASLEFSSIRLVAQATQQGTLRINESINLSNPSDKSILGNSENEVTFALAIPQNATNLRIIRGFEEKDLLLREGYILFIGPVQPGTSQAGIGYDIPTNQPAFARNHIDAPVKLVEVLVPNDSTTFSSAELVLAEPTVVGSTSIKTYRGGPFRAHQEFEFRFGASGGAAQPSSPSSINTPVADGSQFPMLPMPLVALLAVLIFVGIPLLLNKNAQTAELAAAQATQAKSPESKPAKAPETDTEKCNKCGKGIDPKDKFCRHCGGKINTKKGKRAEAKK